MFSILCQFTLMQKYAQGSFIIILAEFGIKWRAGINLALQITHSNYAMFKNAKPDLTENDISL